jgi:hypothetical protein
MLMYVKSQSPPNHRKAFSAFLWGDPDLASPPLRVKNGAFQICRRLWQMLGEDLILLNQPVQSVTFGEFPSNGKNISLIFDIIKKDKFSDKFEVLFAFQVKRKKNRSTSVHSRDKPIVALESSLPFLQLY